VEHEKAEEENYSPKKSEKVVGENMTKEEIEELLGKFEEQESALGGSGSYQIGVLTSMLEGMVKYGQLTPKQLMFANNLKSDIISVDEMSEWRKIFLSEKKEKFDYAVKYYHQNNIQYFNNIVLKAVENSSYIPTRKQYDKFITNNKYSSRVVGEMLDKEPKYIAGDIVQIRDTYTRTTSIGTKYHLIPSGRSFWHEPKKCWGYIVIKNDVLPHAACIGCRRYELLPFGHSQIIVVEERYIKRAKGVVAN